MQKPNASMLHVIQGLHLTCTNHRLTETALYFVVFLAALASNIRSLRPIRSLRSCHPASRFGADSKLVYKYFISFLCNGMRHEFGGAMSMMMMPQPLPQSHTPQDTKCPWPRIEKENVRPTDSTHARQAHTGKTRQRNEQNTQPRARSELGSARESKGHQEDLRRKDFTVFADHERQEELNAQAHQ